MQTLQSQKGQTLVEVVVAIAIIAIAFFGIIELGRSSLRSADTAKGELVGVNLAREGIELVRAIRDNAWEGGATSVAWSDISNMAFNEIMYINSDLSYEIEVPLNNNGKADLLLKYTDGLPTDDNRATPDSYVHNVLCNGDCLETAYTREIQVEYIDETNPYYLVTAKVTFTNRGTVRDIVLHEKLYDWFE